MRLLLISDDTKLAKTLKAPLQAASYQLLTAGPAAAQADDGLPDRIEAVLIDLAYGVPEPGRLCQALRRRPAFKDVPQVLLVPEARVRTLDWRWGANDFLTLPASAEAVLARLQWLLGQLHRVDLSNGLQVGDLVIDFEQFTVSVKGRVVDLTFKEYELLRFLAGHPGKVFTREVLLNKVWGYDFYGGTRTVDVHIRRLRSKIEDARHTFIDTIRHVGYKFLAPED